MSSYIDIKFINLLSTRLPKFKRKSELDFRELGDDDIEEDYDRNESEHKGSKHNIKSYY